MFWWVIMEPFGNFVDYAEETDLEDWELEMLAADNEEY
jgi:hypothetical protein